MLKFKFPQPLISGLIKSRPNRFIMLVEINGQVEKCHCPSTGRIGNIEFKDIPCLLSASDDPQRKTKYTVEAISPVTKQWVGINQTKANAYVEFFLKNNALPKMVKADKIQREVKLHHSKIDFFLNDNCYLEVKTPLIHLPFGNSTKKLAEFTSFERLVRHFDDISSQIKNNQRAIVLLCYLYPAEVFKVPPISNQKIIQTVRKSTKRGLENWQVNFKIDAKGVSLLDYFPLNLF